MIAGIGLTISSNLIVILVGLVILTIGFFAAHAIASGWTGQRATVGRAQATSLYNLFYYGGSSVVGWLGGVVYQQFGWTAMALFVMGLALLALIAAASHHALTNRTAIQKKTAITTNRSTTLT
jgi:YNFM family putative membrane transporter